jgi:putative ABC transport system ATP-binding protein
MTDSGQAALETREVTRYYTMGGTTIRAVDGISLKVENGDFVSLLGTSGSGKSTLLNLIAGLDRPTGGMILAHGKNLAEMSGDELAKHRSLTVGMVFQSFNLLPRMTLEENVELPLRLAEVDYDVRAKRVGDSLERVGLGQRKQHRPSELSGGEQQRAALARALVNRPTILLADEPTGNLDSHTGEEIMDFITQFNKELGMTVVMVTHDPALAARYSKKQFYLKDGKLMTNGARP